MAEVAPTPRNQSLQTAGAIAGSVIVLNVIFWVMSGMYFKSNAGDIGSVRASFAVLTFIVAAMSYGAAVAPRLIGHALSGVIGVASAIGGIAALVSPLPGVVGATLLITGLVLPALTLSSLKYSRSSWAFLIAMLSVLATVTFFGAPKIRHVLHIGLWSALIIPGLMIVGVIALSMVRGEYKTR